MEAAINVKIRLLKDDTKNIEVESGTNLMTALLDAGLPVASSCDGDGVCAKCRVQVHEGMAHLNPPNEIEEFLIERYDMKSNERVSCQCVVSGDVKVHATYW